MAPSSVATLLASLKPLEIQRPWRRYEVDAQAWSEIGRRLGAGEADLLALWGERDHVHLALSATNSPCVVSLAVRGQSYPSLGQFHAAAIRPERAIRDLYGHVPAGGPDARSWLDHGAWEIEEPLGARRRVPLRDAAE